MIDVNQTLSKRETRVFGLVLFPLFCGLVAWKLRHHEVPVYAALAVGVVEALAGLVDERVWRVVYRILMIAVFPIAIVVSNVVLGLLWLLIFTIVGLLARVFGFDPMQRNVKDVSTYFIAKKSDAGSDRYFKQS